MFNFDDANRKSKETMDSMLKSYSETAKGFQAIATETADYSKKSFQDAVSYFESMAGIKSFEAAYELQTNFAKSSYESFVAEATKLGEMYSDLAKTVYKPYESAATSTAMTVSRAAQTPAPSAAI